MANTGERNGGETRPHPQQSDELLLREIETLPNPKGLRKQLDALRGFATSKWGDNTTEEEPRWQLKVLFPNAAKPTIGLRHRLPEEEWMLFGGVQGSQWIVDIANNGWYAFARDDGEATHMTVLLFNGDDESDIWSSSHAVHDKTTGILTVSQPAVHYL